MRLRLIIYRCTSSLVNFIFPWNSVKMKRIFGDDQKKTLIQYKKMSSYHYRKFHCGDKTVVRSSYLHSGISYTGQITYFYWIRAQSLIFFLISKFLFEIACSASSSTDVDALNFRLVQYDKFYSGEQQEDASECLMILIELINKG